ncbi:hypothetical protein KKF34_13220 [Myxococcota bacterium]|nr:hypothetical protein [Myxococcota bacterium]MBU1381928.1 hypothetical protein [Myxococcota bacterium]MBU1497829.1 hypothetical protein [Myxococcota bacterium]
MKYLIVLILFSISSRAMASNCPPGTYFDKDKLKCVARRWVAPKKLYKLVSITNPSQPDLNEYTPEVRKHVLRGNTAFGKKLYQTAGEHYRKAVLISPDRNLYIIAADTFKRAGNLKSAHECYEDYIVNFPSERNIKEIKAQFSLFEELLENRRACLSGITKDCAILEKWLKPLCTKDYPGMCTSLGEVQEKSGRNDEARKSYEVGCINHDGRGCYLVAQILNKKLKEKSGENEIYLKKACLYGFAVACADSIKIPEEKKPEEIKTVVIKPIEIEDKTPPPPKTIIKYRKIIEGLLIEGAVGVNGKIGKDLYNREGPSPVSFCNHDNEEFCGENAGISFSGLFRFHKYIYAGGSIHYGAFKRLADQTENFMLNLNLEGRLYQFATEKLGFYGLLQVGTMHRIVSDSSNSEDSYMHGVNIGVGGGFSFMLNFLAIGIQAKFFQPVWIDNTIEGSIAGNSAKFTAERAEFRHYFVGVTVTYYLPF